MLRQTSVLWAVVWAVGANAALIDEVPSDQKSQLEAGQVVVKSKEIPKAPWPELSLYQVVDAPPKVVWNLFTDYDSAAVYTPNLIAAEVIEEHPDGSKDVKYTVKVPVLQKIAYTVRNQYQKKGDSYEVDWKLLKSPLAKSSDGSLRIEPYGKKQTLMCYTNLCVPITSLVAGLKNEALKEAKKTVAAITGEAEKRAKTAQ